jgi:dihydroorotase
VKVLIKKAKVIDQDSKYHGKQVDLLIINNKIEEIKSSITAPSGVKIISEGNLHVSKSWIDIGCYVGDPGIEYREDFSSLAAAAKMGGYGSIAPLSNTNPAVQTKSAIQYILNKGKENRIGVYPIAALSENNEGKEITEMIDLHHAGAIAFSDGLKSVKHTGLMCRAFEYVCQFDGLIIHHPHDYTLSPDAQMHEGEVSTMLGMRGAPYIAETLMLKRDLELLAYTNSKLCVHGISASDSMKLVKEAKKNNLKVFSTVPYLNLIKTDQDLMSFDSNLKVSPPLRKKMDAADLIKGLKDGTIDAIISNHYPIEEEGKKLEYTYAKFGASGIETCFAAINTYAPSLDLETLIQKLTTGPASILGIEQSPIAVGEKVNLTLFDPEAEWNYNQTYSKSNNNFFLGTTLKGKVIEVFN